jgi:hypothetical protein
MERRCCLGRFFLDGNARQLGVLGAFVLSFVFLG